MQTRLKWIFIALIIKILVILFLMYNLNLFDNNGQIGICNGDCPDYLNTARTLAETGVFGRNINGQIIPYAGRMLGYDVVLAPLSLFFDEFWVKNLTYLLQIILSAISTYYLAKTAYLIFSSWRIFYFVFFLYGINSFVTFYDLFILTESFSVSALIISIYLLVVEPNKKRYFFSGLLFTWAFVMRPFYGVILLFCTLLIIYENYFLLKKRLQYILVCLFVYLLTFLTVEIIWISRNYIHFNRFIPLAEGGFRDGKRLALMNLMSAWGFDFIDWNSNAEILVFLKPLNITHLKPKYTKVEDLPTYIYTSAYNIDSLKNIQLSFSINRIHDTIITEKLKLYKQVFIQEKPFYYYVIAPLRLIKNFLFHSGTYNISNKVFSQQPLFSQFLKICYSLLYYFILLIGLLAYFWLLNKKDARIFLIMVIPIYIIILFSFAIRAIEYRYFITAYPFLTILACYMLNLVWSYFFKPKAIKP